MRWTIQLDEKDAEIASLKKLGSQLEVELWKATSERAAYRKLAILFYAKQITVKKLGGTKEADFVDAMAQRLLKASSQEKL